MTKYYAGAAALAVVAGLGITYVLTLGSGDGDQFAQCRASAIAGGPGELGGPFTLVSETGETVTDADVLDKPALLYFGYTFCPDVCPLDTVRNADAVDILAEDGFDVRPIFISIDPERDTPEALDDFTANIHPEMLGLTGSQEQVAAASKAYKTYFKRQETGDEYYLVDHSTFSYLTLPGHGFVEFFRRDLSPQALADRTKCFLETS